jgi:hypothetical protein
VINAVRSARSRASSSSLPLFDLDRDPMARRQRAASSGRSRPALQCALD